MRHTGWDISELFAKSSRPLTKMKGILLLDRSACLRSPISHSLGRHAYSHLISLTCHPGLLTTIVTSLRIILIPLIYGHSKCGAFSRVTDFRRNCRALLSVLKVIHSFPDHHCGHLAAESCVVQTAVPGQLIGPRQVPTGNTNRGYPSRLRGGLDACLWTTARRLQRP
jgi:hypothetical protein